jgi:hypothetical protein
MGIKVTGNASTFSVSSVRPRVSVSVVDPVANVTYSLAASKIAYIELTAAAYLDTSGKFRYIQESVIATDGTALLLSKPFSNEAFTSDDQVLDFGKSLAEEVSFEDSLVATIIFLRDLFDESVLADAVVLSIAKSAVDSVAMSSSVTRDFAKSVADTQAVVDAAAKTVAKALANSVASSDVATLSHSKLVADAAATTDEVVRNIVKSLADAASFNDSLVSSFSKSLTDGVAMNDGFGAADGLDFVFSTTFSNASFVTDTTVQTLLPTYSDSVGTTDSGFVLSQDYCDLTYFAEDYVGTAITF